MHEANCALTVSGPPSSALRAPSPPGEGEARTLVELYDGAQNGMRRVIALGLFAHEVKSRLKHGQFGSWLKEHAPKLSREVDGRPLASCSLAAYMQLTSGVLESAGFKLGEYLQMAKIQTLDLSHGGEILLLDEGQVPEGCREFREKICSVVDGKTQRQLFLEFKTADDDEEAVKVKKAGGAPVIQFHCRHCAPGSVILRGKLGSEVECPKCKTKQTAKPDPRSAAELHEELKLTAHDEVESLAGALIRFGDAVDSEDPQDWSALVSKPDRQRVLDLCVRISTWARRGLNKSPKKKRGKRISTTDKHR